MTPDLNPEPQSTDLVSEHTEFQSHMPYMGLSRGSLTIQQEKLTLLISSGMTIAAAGRGAGTVLSLQALDKYRMIGFENPLVSHPLLH